MDNRFGEMKIFLRVVESGSFSEAARLSLTTPSTVSKLIGRLETRLGVRLVERSTRKLSVTPEGHAYYNRAQTLMTEIDDMESTLSQKTVQLQGTVRINASVAFGTLLLEPLLPAFWETYPDILIDLSLSDEMADLYLDRTDIAFRVGRLQDSSLMARHLGKVPRLIVGSPAYLKQFGRPETVDDLEHHHCLGFNFRRAAPVWPLQDRGRIVDRIIRGPLLANNGETVRRAAIGGAGLARLAEYHVREDLSEGRLVEVLTNSGTRDEEEIHALYQGGKQLPHRVRGVLDFMVPRLQARLRPVSGNL
ncbi:LysR family transcriptional regulator [Gluconobacter kanchanaburiensis]|uniref:Transcriptional regulator n=1 Tax=Gluconobacter kanchanaburiensis NBRC 103587 TaxID=1307948 RepID=A0A511B7B0_9PROT|nr:LysR family transcriptional regulator [Gluconobacter kanchanaburiensis]MBF0860517.1 LysR family transcriptional regulator [Gluconobacter kanchanaburiensis]GBR69274.1 transcriptional regulator [Gluconobacter kanchanaburiensis NBRC 103587]GEK96234.1 transcriptional regulator [Gluconobacter kanchanaburiensis NBRC 103587]